MDGVPSSSHRRLSQQIDVPQDGESDEEDDVQNIEEIIPVLNNFNDVKVAMKSLEDFCLTHNSGNITLCYQMLSNFEREYASQMSEKAKHMMQPTLDKFFTKK